MNLEQHKNELVDSCQRDPAVTSLVFFGSSCELAGARRDEWSDLDFNVFLIAAATHDQPPGWGFLPRPEAIVLQARDGTHGGVVIYNDATLFEFGAGQPWPISDPEREIAINGGDLCFTDPPPAPDPADAVRLFLAKLYIGMGRHRRGERVAASAHVRTHALKQLCWALRTRLAPQLDTMPNPFDPTRRLEHALPELAHHLADLLDADLETCARGLYDTAREHLEPGWAEFPTPAADLIARKLAWTHPPEETPR